MKVDLIHVYAMHMALCFPYQTVYCHYVILDVFGQVEVFPDYMFNVMKAAVAVSMHMIMAMRVLMIVTVVVVMVVMHEHLLRLLGPVHQDRYMGAGDAAFY